MNLSTAVLIDARYALEKEERDLLDGAEQFGWSPDRNALLGEARRSLAAINRELGFDPVKEARRRAGFAEPAAVHTTHCEAVAP